MKELIKVEFNKKENNSTEMKYVITKGDIVTEEGSIKYYEDTIGGERFTYSEFDLLCGLFGDHQSAEIYQKEQDGIYRLIEIK